MIKIKKSYNIALIFTLIRAVMCADIVYSSSETLRVFIGQSSERVSKAIIGPKYEFGKFRQVEPDAYKGDIIIENKIFKLSIDGRPISNMFLYEYILYYNGEEIGATSWCLEGDVPKFAGLVIEEEYRKDNISKIIPSLKGISLAEVLMEIRFKDISLNDKAVFSKTLGADLMGLLPPNPRAIGLVKKYKMVPLDKDTIINDIKDGKQIVNKTCPGHGWFEVSRLEESNGRFDWTPKKLVLKKRGVDEAIFDKDICGELYIDASFRQIFVDIIEGRHDTYEIYMGGRWGFHPNDAEQVEKYFESKPSWQASDDINIGNVYQTMKKTVLDLLGKLSWGRRILGWL
ncbi:MAG: hypothetical protein P9L93_02990 [Candidatus Gorgyraea atricola]|nr:hypothetical protein [Candidatus Gorgyraea atricola]